MLDIYHALYNNGRYLQLSAYVLGRVTMFSQYLNIMNLVTDAAIWLCEDNYIANADLILKDWMETHEVPDDIQEAIHEYLTFFSVNPVYSDIKIPTIPNGAKVCFKPQFAARYVFDRHVFLKIGIYDAFKDEVIFNSKRIPCLASCLNVIERGALTFTDAHTNEEFVVLVEGE